jgi:hypothetical protein
LKLFKQDEATFVTKANLLEATIVVLSNVEKMLADTTSQLFNRPIVTIWDDRRDIHIMFVPFGSIIPERGKDMTMPTRISASAEEGERGRGPWQAQLRRDPLAPRSFLLVPYLCRITTGDFGI